MTDNVIRIVNDHHDRVRVDNAKAKRRQMREDAEKETRQIKKMTTICAFVSSSTSGFWFAWGVWPLGFAALAFCLCCLWVHDIL